MMKFVIKTYNNILTPLQRGQQGELLLYVFKYDEITASYPIWCKKKTGEALI